MPTEINLSDGRIAVIREGFGKDLSQAQVMAGTDPGALMKCLVSSLTTIDGKALTPEEWDELPLKDVLALQKPFNSFL